MPAYMIFYSQQPGVVYKTERETESHVHPAEFMAELKSTQFQKNTLIMTLDHMWLIHPDLLPFLLESAGHHDILTITDYQ